MDWANSEIVFLEPGSNPNVIPERIKLEDLKIGDYVAIVVSLDLVNNSQSITVIRNLANTEPISSNSPEGSPATSSAR